MRKRALVSCCLLAVLLSTLFATLPAGAAQRDRTPARPAATSWDRILVFTGDTGSPRSEAAQIARTGVAELRRLGRDHGFLVDQDTTGATFTASRLSRFDAVVFLNATGDVLSSSQEAAFEDYYTGGGGLVAVHEAINAEPGWDFLTEVLGARGDGSSSVQEATVKVADRVHPAGEDLPLYWESTQRWLDYTDNVRHFQHVLATVDENTYSGGGMGHDHPVVWCGDHHGGRSFYTGAGGSVDAYTDAEFASHLVGAIQWAAGGEGDCGATVLANYTETVIAKNSLTGNNAERNAGGIDTMPVGEPIGFEVLPDGRILQTIRVGPTDPETGQRGPAEVRMHDPDAGTSETIFEIPVYAVSEDGLYGPAIDKDFEENHWVYLFYSPVQMEGISQSGVPYPETTPPGNAPTTGPTPDTWDPWLGYFQLSRFKFVDATGSTPAHLDPASEQKILKMEVDRGACCHVAGDINFDSDNNLWLSTGDDTPAGGGGASGFGPFNDDLTNESQSFNVGGATGGTFTLTFDGQTTAPIPFPLDNATIEAALEALPNIDDVVVTGNNAVLRTVQFRGQYVRTDVPEMTGDGSGLTGTTTVTMNTTTQGGWYWAPHADARRGALNTNDLRGKLLRISVNEDGSYDIPEGNMFAPGTPLTRPEVYAMGFRNPFRFNLDSNDVAYVTDYSPDSRVPQVFRGPEGTGRVEIVDEPANYGWPVCYGPELPYFKWDWANNQPENPDDPEPFDCAGGPENTSRWNTGLTQTPPVKQPEIWYSYNDNAANNPQGTPCFASYGMQPPGTCPQLFPELGVGGVGPHGAAPFESHLYPDGPGKFPDYYDGTFIFGEFTRDWLREVRLDDDGEIFKINPMLNCVGNPNNIDPVNAPWLCDAPMHMEFGPDGNFYLLTYGSGFFNQAANAKLAKYSYTPPSD